MNDLRERLHRQEKSDLVEFIASLHGHMADLDRRIEFLASQGDPAGQIKLLKQRIQSINRGRRFIAYRESLEFGQDLGMLLDDIAVLIQQRQAPKKVFSLIDAFMQTHTKVFNRVDDSAGAVGDVYREGVELWLQAAANLRAEQKSKPSAKSHDWPTELRERHNDNGFAVWDELLSKSAVLLSKEELEQLGWRFENDARQTMANAPSGFDRDFECTRACHGLRGVAMALRDADRLEKSLRLRSPDLNSAQKAALVRDLLTMGLPKRGLRWLEGEWDAHFRSHQLKLLDACYLAAGDQKALKSLRQQRYAQMPTDQHLHALLELCDESESLALEASAVDKASKIEPFIDRIDTLLALDAYQRAADEIVRHPEHLAITHYTALGNWAKMLAQHRQPLAASLCYRALINDILSSARSKAYRHAARYVRQLVALSEEIGDFGQHADHQSYVGQLEAQHGRKRSFWSLLG